MKYYLIFFFFISPIFSNLDHLFCQLIRSDDFKFKNNYWYWREDGNQSIPTVHNGLLHLQLQDAIGSEYCNTEIYDPSEPYSPGTQVRMRLKATPQHIGSRGWGFWDGDLAPPFYILFDYDVAWIMQQGASNNDPNYNWFQFGVNTDFLYDKKTIDLDGIVDETKWHTYKIIWNTNKVSLYIDDDFIYETVEQIPDQNMRVDLWIDNRVVNINQPWNPWPPPNYASQGSEMFVDFIEVTGISGPAISRIASGSTILWDSPNTFASGKSNALWKNYNFNITESGQTLIFITGDAESYGTLSDDDDLRLVIDETDYGWNTLSSLDGNALNGSGASVVLPTNLSEGEHSLKLYSDITPFVRDVIILNGPNGKILINNQYNETPTVNDGLWKNIDFTIDRQNEIVFLISGTGFQNDKLRIEIDGNDYLWTGEYSIDGDVLLGVPKTVVITETLLPGSHTIKLYKQGSPKLFNVAGYSVSISYVDTKVYLEGCYNSNSMVSSISQSSNFPSTQPYNSAPWNYGGSEYISTIPANTIDWVLVELRSDQIAPTKSYYRAAILKSNGDIDDVDGGDIVFRGINEGYYYIAIYHRNHLPILSSQTILIP